MREISLKVKGCLREFLKTFVFVMMKNDDSDDLFLDFHENIMHEILKNMIFAWHKIPKHDRNLNNYLGTIPSSQK